MRKFFIILSIIFGVIGIVFTILPMGTLALLPIGLAILFSVLAIVNSKNNNKKLPKWLLIISAIILLSSIGKDVFVKDEVTVDQKFIKEKEQSKVEAKKDLEDLEGLK
jgi:hypothetical protein